MSSLSRLFLVIGALAAGHAASGQHADVWLDVDDGKVVTTQAEDGVPLPDPVRVFGAEFGDSGCTPFTADPGWRAAAGTFSNGTQLGWNAVDAFELWTGDGFELTGGEFVDISFASLSFEVHDGPAAGFELFVQADGGFHQHLNFCLDGCPLICDPPPGADPGIYLLNLEVTCTEADPSDPIWFVFNYLDTEENHDAAIAWAETYLAGDPCPWDCAEPSDGQVSVVDFLALLAEWGQVGTPCDVDGGGVGVTDFLALLANWGACPS
jgi:hypothetical protein